MIPTMPMVLLQGPPLNASAVQTIVNSTLNATVLNPNNISNGVVVYVQQTLTVIIEILAVLAISMQVAKGYFLRILRKFTLRLAADLWWMIYVLLRDASIFLVLFLGMGLFWPAANLTYPIGVPFMPLAIDFFAFALVLILVKDTDEDPKLDMLLTAFVGIGTLLFFFGNTFITESATQLATLPPTVSLSVSNPWGYLYATFNSLENPAMYIYSFYVCFALLVLAGLVAIIWSFRAPGGVPKSSIAAKPNPITKQTASPPTPPGQAK